MIVACSLFLLLMLWPLEMRWCVEMVIWLGKSGLLLRSVPSPLLLGWQGPGHTQGLVLGEGKAEFRVCSVGGKKHRSPDLVAEVLLLPPFSLSKKEARSCMFSFHMKIGDRWSC